MTAFTFVSISFKMKFEKGGPEYWHDTQGDIAKDHVMARCPRANQITRHLDILNTIG